MSETVGTEGNAKRLEKIFHWATLKIENAASTFLQRQLCILHSLLSVVFMPAAIDERLHGTVRRQQSDSFKN